MGEGYLPSAEKDTLAVEAEKWNLVKTEPANKI
jgi:hypothetical protein